MSRYVIVDAANLFFRCLHGSSGDAYSKAGLALHLIFRSIKKVVRENKADHVVWCLEGKSWRYELYPKYKAHRKVQALLKTQREKEESEVFQAVLDDFIEFIKTKTNNTVLQCTRVEGDDFVARWVQNHPDDVNIVISGDSDFIQLLAPNVIIYDGVKDIYIRREGVVDGQNRELSFTLRSDGKLKVGDPVDPKKGFTPPTDWWKYSLFLKTIRGDAGDNIMSAYPKVRETKLKAAWDDRHDCGYAWNNLMLQTWQDPDDGEIVVKDAYAFNQRLIDLTMQPDDIKELMDATIINEVQKPMVQGVGVHFLKFCNKNGLVNISRESAEHAAYLNSPYRK